MPEGTRDDRSQVPGAAARPAGPGVSRAAKLLPPRDPSGTLDRTELEARLAAGTDRRLTIIVAGAGFGKSTLASRVARTRNAAWYTVDAVDRHLGTFAAGVVAAIRRMVPVLPEDLATPIATAVDARDEPEAQQRGQAAATLVADALQVACEDELLLVLDDCHEIDGASGSWRFVEALVRFAPDNLHVLLVSRNDPPFGVERLRAQGEVSDIGGGALAFTAREIETLVTTLLPEDVIPASARADAAARILTVTHGWPAAVRLTIEALRSAPEGGREAVLDRLQHPEGPLFAYLAEEVVAAASDEVRATLARAAHFERFSGPLLEAAGVASATRELDGLARRGLFLQPLPGDPGWFVLHGLIREYARARLPLTPDEIRAMRLRAAAWLEGRGRLDDALAHLVAATAPDELATFLDRHGPALVLAGSTRAVTEAADMLPEAMRSPRLDRACGEAYMVRGDWRSATKALTRAAGSGETLDPASAWRLGLVHGLRGAYDEALAIYARAEVTGEDPLEEALLFAYVASAHYHRGEVAESDAAARRSLDAATASGDARALAAAHTAVGMSAELEHDFTRAALAFDRALEAATLAHDALQEVRVRTARGALEIDRGDVVSAFRTLDDAVRLAEAVGFTSFHGRALVNRGRAHQGLGRFEEALADFSLAREIYDRVGSPGVAYPLVREGNLHLLRGDPLLAKFSFEAAMRSARGAGDAGSLAPALVGLAQCLVDEEPERARELAAEAVAKGRDVEPLTVLLGAARLHVQLADREVARRLAREATNVAAARQDQPGYAAGLEIQAQTTDSPGEAELLLERAAAVWTESNIPYGYARNRLILASLVEGDRARAAAADAAATFRSLGARGPAGQATELVETLDRAARPALEIAALGRFRVLRDGEPIPPTAWQSKKARDLLKILVSRRGRPTTRETLFELLWPDEDPEPLANRLSVALATVRSVLDPEKRYAADWFVGGDKQAVWLDLGHVELDVEAFLGAASEGLRLARSGNRAAARTSLEAAETRYGGDFLEEDPYEDWAVGIREEAQAAYISVTRLLADEAATTGDADGATRYYLRILERDGYDEAAHVGLVGALLAAGRHGEARRRYGIYSARMEEMGVEAAPFPSAPGRRPTAGAPR
ncbi:MAG TPA: BTAD domain-containing putative transcriptional regulator [Candidatus Limnocylindrales bacterium]|nr:BTAD domain-containing putative transcriptional regulator [Candidatus Limnocylindrales bacterium]